MVQKLVIYSVHILLAVSSLVSAKKALCPKHCKCYYNKFKRYTGECDGSQYIVKLHFIPRFPSKTREVVFIHNSIFNLSRETLNNVSSLPITHLNLKYNNINFIESDAFLDFTHLIRLDISGNANVSQIDVAQTLFNLSKSSIKEVGLNKMQWYSCEGMFDGLIGSNITKIELSHNDLRPFHGTWFSQLENLTKLDISWNLLKDNTFSFKGLSKLTWLNLSGNLLLTIPDFCKDGLYNLVSLYFSRATIFTISYLRNYSRCLQKLEYINLSELPLRILPNSIFSELKSLKVVKMIKMSSQLTKIYAHAFDSPSLQSLTFSRADGFRFSREIIKKGFFVPSAFFKQCFNLTELDLSYNMIEFTSKEIREMFNPLKKLKAILLDSMDLSYIPRDFFHRFPLLEKISLIKNVILPWTDGSVFDGLLNLKELYLRSNKISMVHSTSFSATLLEHIRVLDFTYNPFSCTCDLMWFRNWMKNSNVRIIGKNNYRCDDRKTRVIDYNPTPAECSILLITASVGSGVGFIMITIITVYFCRWRIRFQLYKIRSTHRKYQRLHDEDEFTYTAYIIYCYEDFRWVKNNLISRIETEKNFKLCIPHRDFELGKIFADNIIDHMNMSKTFVPVLSNNFAKNEWCLFQLAVARSKLTNDGNLSIFPIMLEEVEFDNLNAAIYSLVKMSDYAAWNKDDSALELFWDKVQSHLQSVN